MGLLELTDNCQDLSTDKGYQFKFFCERCGNGFLTTFRANKLGVAQGFLGAAGRLLGGVADRVADSAYEVQRAVGGPAHDKAVKEAVEEIKGVFKQCSRCGQWVCPEHCWNESRGMCEQCAPDLTEELAQMQQEATIEQLRQRVQETDFTSHIDVRSEARTKCPHCGAKAGPGKFCQECGKPLRPATECAKCGAKLDAGAKFCGECGAPGGG